MPVNYQQIKSQVKTWGETAPQRAQRIGRLCDQSREILECLADPAALQEKIGTAARLNPQLRTAAPTAEPPAGCFPLPALVGSPVVIAADGSQINPDRHAAVEFCVINAGAFILPPAGQPPAEKVQSRLLAADELVDENGPITEEVVALRRDLEERRFIARLAVELPPPVIALTDGPLELFMERESSRSASFRQLFAEYLQILADIALRKIVTAGYVDKPHGDLLVRMLEIQLLPAGELEQAGRARPLAGVIDSELFLGRLQPGERSAVFAILSPSARSFSGSLALHFFYLNTGRPGSPWITRVEIPAWVAASPPDLEALHAVLVQQCRMLGNAPYPYVLQRAHEVAVVRQPEREMIEGMLQAELLQRGLAMGRQSNKQHHKSHTGRTR